MSVKTTGCVDLCNKLMLTHDAGIVVLQHLATTQERVRVCRSVSKECRDIVDGGVRSLKASLQSLSNTANRLQLCFPKLEELSFDRVSAGADEMLLDLAQHKPQLLQTLRSLDLSNCSGLEADALLQILKSCNHLCKLTLPHRARGVQSTGQEFLEVLCKHGTKLTHLAGAGDYVCTETVSLLAALSNLQSLDIVRGLMLGVSAASALQPLSSLTNLQHLQLGNSLACHDSCALAASLPRLDSLEFAYANDHLDCFGGLSHQDLVPLVGCRTLKHLTLSAVSCSDQLLSVLARCKVSSLSLLAGRFAAQPKYTALLQQQLSSLQLRVNDSDIPALAAALPELKGLSSLSVSIHRSAEDCGLLMPAIFGLPRLQQLSLGSHYNGLKEQELVGLPTAGQLTSVSLRNHFSDATLCRTLSVVPQLRELHLASCESVSDVGLACLVGHCKELRSVRLELMRGVGAAGVAAVAAGPHVARIVVEGCRNVLAEECRDVMKLSNKLDLEVVKLR